MSTLQTSDLLLTWFLEVPSVQLNEYETVLNFLQFSENLTWDCLLISVLLPEFD